MARKMKRVKKSRTFEDGFDNFLEQAFDHQGGGQQQNDDFINLKVFAEEGDLIESRNKAWKGMIEKRRHELLWKRR